MSSGRIATVVSVFPFATQERKPGQAKVLYEIPACEPDDIQLVYIEDSFYVHRIIGTKQEIRVPVHCDDIANSIVDDFCNSIIGANETAKPGMTWVPGRVTKPELFTRYKDVVPALKEMQRLWYIQLVMLADDEWNKYHQHKLISEMQLYAAKALGLERDWVISYTNREEFTDCPSCRTRVSNLAAKCANCGYILNEKRAIELGIMEDPKVVKAAAAKINKALEEAKA